MVCVFARKTSEPLASLVKQIDEKIGENGKLKSFVVLMPQEGRQSREDLKKLAKDAGIKHVPLTMFGESPDGPPDYEISKDADVTVLMWNGQQVKVNHAYKGELTEKDIEAIVAEHPEASEQVRTHPNGVIGFHYSPARQLSATRAPPGLRHFGLGFSRYQSLERLDAIPETAAWPHGTRQSGSAGASPHYFAQLCYGSLGRFRRFFRSASRSFWTDV